MLALDGGRVTLHTEPKEESMGKLTFNGAASAAARRYGFNETDYQYDPQRREMILTAAHSAMRAEARQEVDAVIRQVADELHLNPNVYTERRKIFDEIARRGLPMATSERFTEI
jgi:hypothetical protein